MTRLLLACLLALPAWSGCGGKLQRARTPGPPPPAPAPAPAATPMPVPIARPEPTPGPAAAPKPGEDDGPDLAPAPIPDPVLADPAKLTPVPAADWKQYRVSVQGMGSDRAVRIDVDLGAAAAAPDRSRPWLVQLTVQCIDPSDDGCSDRSGESQLAAIEAAIRALLPAVQGRYVGRVRTDGSYQFFVYTPNDVPPEWIEAKLERRFAKHTWLPFSQEDPEWSTYREQLLPEAGERTRPAGGG